MSALVGSLLQFSTLDAQKITIENVSISRVLNDVLTNLFSLIEVKSAQINLPNDLPEVIQGDEALLRVVFQNLINNALKFVAPGITPQIHIDYVEDGNFHVFKLKDNGIGIESEYLDKVFLMFERLNASHQYEGSGIGLATCKKIMLMHKGHIQIESEPNVGSVFILSLPKTLSD